MTTYYQIYLITNTINNKKYVGQTKRKKQTSYLQRWKGHLKSSLKLMGGKYNNRFHCAIAHYGEEAFTIGCPLATLIIRIAY